MKHAALIGASLLLLAGSVGATEWVVSPRGPHSDLAAVLAEAAAGDVIRVHGGIHRGPFVAEHSVRLLGEAGAVLEGGGQGTVMTLRGADSEVSGFTIRGTGVSLDLEDAGIAVRAPRARVTGNHLEDVLFGIDLNQASGSTLTGNYIGGKSVDLGRRGDAIRLWESHDCSLEGNLVQDSRDVVIWYSRRLRLVRNQFRQGRYGLHFMYSHDADVEENLLTGNSVGAYLMYSHDLRFRHNVVVENRGPSGYGLGLKDMNDVVIEENLFAGNRVGLFLDNTPLDPAARAVVTKNHVSGNDIGVLLLPNVRRAELRANAFLENGEQAGWSGGGSVPGDNRWIENHWSDYAGFDADQDGVGDLPYRSDQLFESLADRHPELRFFSGSPLAAALDLAARAFPLVRPQPRLEDPRPHMRPAPLELPAIPGRVSDEGLSSTALGLLIASVGMLLAPAAARSLFRGARVESKVNVVDATNAAVVARELTVRYGAHRALDAVSFVLRPGESIALWGPNGAGKTTALRALLGVVPCEGELRVEGHDPRREGKLVRSRVGFVPQELALPGDWTVVECLEFFARLRRVGSGPIPALLAEMKLESHAAKSVAQLSGGLKQRLALALAMLSNPPILLLDEPTANLDAAGRRALLELLGRLKAAGKTLIFSSHRVADVRALADRVLCLEGGKLLSERPGAGFDDVITAEDDDD